MSTESTNKTAPPRGVSSSAIVRFWCRIFGHDWSVSDAVSSLSAISTELRNFDCWCDRCGLRGKADWCRFIGVKNFRESKPNGMRLMPVTEEEGNDQDQTTAKRKP